MILTVTRQPHTLKRQSGCHKNFSSTAIKESNDVQRTYRAVVPSTTIHKIFLPTSQEARVKLVKRAVDGDAVNEVKIYEGLK
ncbi:hypothetical protein SDJN02_20538, partial [Cucurbita argyrosperma subsp. argyrosperma]